MGRAGSGSGGGGSRSGGGSGDSRSRGGSSSGGGFSSGGGSINFIFDLIRIYVYGMTRAPIITGIIFSFLSFFFFISALEEGVLIAAILLGPFSVINIVVSFIFIIKKIRHIDTKKPKSKKIKYTRENIVVEESELKHVDNVQESDIVDDIIETSEEDELLDKYSDIKDEEQKDNKELIDAIDYVLDDL